MTGRFAVIAEFDLASAESPGAFRALADEDARQSRTLEPGCQQFDVLVPDGTGERVVLCKTCDGSRAFRDRLETDHYHAFNRQGARLVKSKPLSEPVPVCDGE